MLANDENAPPLSVNVPADAPPSKAETVGGAPPSCGPLTVDTLPEEPTPSARGLYGSQPGLLLDTLETMHLEGAGSPAAADSTSDEDDASDEDPEAEAQRELVQAETMLRYGLAKLHEICAKHGRGVVEDHVRVFATGPDDGIVALNAMLARAHEAAAAEQTESDADAEQEGLADADPLDDGAHADVNDEPQAEEEGLHSAQVDATCAALDHVAHEFSLKWDAVCAAHGAELEQRQLAVLFSEVLLRNALAFLQRQDEALVNGVFTLLGDAGEEPGSTGFDLLNELIADARGIPAEESEASAGLASAAAGSAVHRAIDRAAGEDASAGAEAAADAPVAQAEAASDETSAAGSEEEDAEVYADDVPPVMPPQLASQIAMDVLVQLHSEYDARLAALADGGHVPQQLAHMLLAEAFVKHALSYLRGCSPADMQRFWALGHNLRAASPGELNGAELLAQLLQDVGADAVECARAEAEAEAGGDDRVEDEDVGANGSTGASGKADDLITAEAAPMAQQVEAVDGPAGPAGEATHEPGQARVGWRGAAAGVALAAAALGALSRTGALQRVMCSAYCPLPDGVGVGFLEM